MSKEEIRAAAERMGDIATNCNHASQHWDTFLVACAPCIRRVAEREITALVEKARDEALEEAAKAQCPLCMAWGLSVASRPEPSVFYFHPSTKEHGGDHCQASAVRSLQREKEKA